VPPPSALSPKGCWPRISVDSRKINLTYSGAGQCLARALRPITRQTASRQVDAIMRAAGSKGPQACPRGLRYSYGVAAVLWDVSLTTTAVCTTAVGAEARELVSCVWAWNRTCKRRLAPDWACEVLSASTRARARLSAPAACHCPAGVAGAD